MDHCHTRLLTAMAIAVVIGVGQPTFAARAGSDPDDCEIVATTGRSVAGRDCEGKPFARVDHRPAPHLLRIVERKGELPIDRLRSRGEGRPKATGDKGLRRELREGSRSHN